MKREIKKLVNYIGFDIVRFTKEEKKVLEEPQNSKSKKSDKLKFHITETGRYYLPEDAVDDIVANSIINNQVFDKEIVDCAANFIKPGSVVLDLGANYGQMSVLFSKMVTEKGKVYSFDADDFIFEILKKNLNANNCKNVEPFFGAVHNIEGEVLVFPEQDFVRFGAYGSYGIDYTATKKGREVPTLTIDGLNIQREISFMKIDIQGGDLFAMQGAIETIKRNQMPILFEFEYLFQDDMHLVFQDYVDFVSQINYKFARVINAQNYLILPK